MHSQGKVTKITKYKKYTVCTYMGVMHKCLMKICDVQHNYPSYSTKRHKCTKKLICLRSYTISMINLKFSLLLASALQVKWNYLFSLLTFSLNSSSTSWSIDTTFPYRRTDVLHQIAYPRLATKPMKHLRTKVCYPLPVLSTRPQQPCRSVWALWLQKAERIFNLLFLQGKNFNIMSRVVSCKHKQISHK